MKRMVTVLSAALLCLAGSGCAVAGMFDNYYDYQNEDGTYSYYFDQGVTVTMDEDWYRNTIVKAGDDGASFYQKDSFEAYAGQGQTGGWLFTIGASVNTDFSSLPAFEYIGFDEENAMNYFAVLPTDYQAYMDDESIRAGYDALWAGVKDVIAGIRIGTGARNETDAQDETVGQDGSDAQDGTAGQDGSDTGDETVGQSGSSGQGAVLSGGWQVTEDAAVTDVARAVFEKATDSLEDVSCEPVALLATQVVAGMNYCFLCRSTAAVSDAVPVYKLMYIWQDPVGNVRILEMRDMEFGLSADGGTAERGADVDAADPQADPGTQHRITLTGDEYVFADCPDSAKAGEKVSVKTIDVADGEVKIEVNGSDIGTWEMYDLYTFIMPDEDVEVRGWISTAGYPGA